MAERNAYERLRLATSMHWLFGCFYLVAGMAAFVIEAFREPSPRAFAIASKWLLPGPVYFLVAICAKPGRRWILVVSFACTAMLTLGLLVLLGWLVWWVGLRDLAAWREPLASTIALLIVLFVVVHCYLMYQVVGARSAGEVRNRRGFETTTPTPVRVIEIPQPSESAHAKAE